MSDQWTQIFPDWDGSGPCCQQWADAIAEYGRWTGGSHYHCGNCGRLSGGYGHWSNGEFRCPE